MGENVAISALKILNLIMEDILARRSWRFSLGRQELESHLASGR